MTPSSSANRSTFGTRMRWFVLPLLLAAATAALIAKTDKQVMEITAAASFTNLADDLLLMERSNHAVKVVVSGTAHAFKTVDLQSAACTVDLSGLEAGTHTLPVQMSDISLPEGLTPQTLITPSLTVRLEPLAHKVAGVVAVLEGNPAPGHAVATVKLTPDRIVLKGTEAALSAVDMVKTRPINLEGAADSFKKQVPLNLPETISVDPPLRIVVAEVAIRERMVTRVLENVPVAAKGAAVGHRIEPATIALTVSGPEVIINTIESDPAFSVTVDLTGLPPGTHRLTATIKLPVPTKLVRVSPERFSVTIDK